MRGPFARRCFDHPEMSVDSSISDTGHESVWCRSGHRAKSWYVVDRNEKKIAIGHLHSAPLIIDADMLGSLHIDKRFGIVPPPPTRSCKKGHSDAWKLQSDGCYKCEVCRREKYEENKEKIMARYVANRIKKGLPVNVRRKKGTKKNV